MDWVDQPQKYNDLYGIVQFLQGSHLENSLKILKIGWVAFYSLTFQLKGFDFQSNQERNSPQCSHVSATGYEVIVRGRPSKIAIKCFFVNVNLNLMKNRTC